MVAKYLLVSFLAASVVIYVLVWANIPVQPIAVQAQTGWVAIGADTGESNLGDSGYTNQLLRASSLAGYLIHSGLLTNVTDIRLDGVSTTLSGNSLAYTPLLDKFAGERVEIVVKRAWFRVGQPQLYKEDDRSATTDDPLSAHHRRSSVVRRQQV
jgi:hypothetical protein